MKSLTLHTGTDCSDTSDAAQFACIQKLVLRGGRSAESIINLDMKLGCSDVTVWSAYSHAEALTVHERNLITTAIPERATENNRMNPLFLTGFITWNSPEISILLSKSCCYVHFWHSAASLITLICKYTSSDLSTTFSKAQAMSALVHWITDSSPT
jgi:hypothetical protein